MLSDAGDITVEGSSPAAARSAGKQMTCAARRGSSAPSLRYARPQLRDGPICRRRPRARRNGVRRLRAGSSARSSGLTPGVPVFAAVMHVRVALDGAEIAARGGAGHDAQADERGRVNAGRMLLAQSCRERRATVKLVIDGSLILRPGKQTRLARNEAARALRDHRRADQ